jgi:predicted anti-sigma-YlaC factor YlaD
LNCKSVIEQLSDYLDGELKAAVQQELEQHLCGCKECELVVNQTKLTLQVFCDAELVELPEEISKRLHEALRRKLSISEPS